MDHRTKWIVGGVLAVAVVGGGTGLAVASGAHDEPITGSALDRATAAALEHTGGGTVIETEVGDDGAAYSLDVRLADGTDVEVNLDEHFNVIGREADGDGASDQDGSGGD